MAQRSCKRIFKTTKLHYFSIHNLHSFEWTWTGTDASFGEGCYTKDEKVTEGILISPLNGSRETQYTPHDEKAGTNETPNWLRKSLKYVIKIEIALKEDNAKGNLLKNDTLLRGKKLCHCHILKEMSTMYIVSKRVIKRVVEIKTAQDVSMKLIFCKYIYNQEIMQPWNTLLSYMFPNNLYFIQL